MVTDEAIKFTGPNRISSVLMVGLDVFEHPTQGLVNHRSANLSRQSSERMVASVGSDY
jgi:hypothetical protein